MKEKYVVDPEVGFRVDQSEKEAERSQRQELQDNIYALAQEFAPECGGWTNVPNWHWDRLQGLLPTAFYSMASYAWRRTVGTGKLEDRIADSQFEHGAMMHNDEVVRDYGCGISGDTVTAGRDFLHQAGVMVEIARNNAPKNEGPKIRIEIDPSKINWEFLMKEKARRRKSGKKKTTNGIEGRKQKSRERRGE